MQAGSSKEFFMAYTPTDKSVTFDADALAATIKEMVGKTRMDSDVDKLDALRKLIRRNVPFTLRGYFSAYLLRELLSAQAPQPRRSRSERAERPARAPQVRTAQPDAPATPEAAAAPRQPKVLPEGARTLYLNIGKMKRLYAKDLSALLQEKLEISKDDILSIRIHDKYTFITMQEAHCEKAIQLLNGTEINGRTVAISYSNRE